MSSSIDRLPTHCACTLRQHYEFIEQHTQRFFSHPVASCNVHLVLFPWICWDFTKVLLCEWRSWFIKPDFTSIQAICPAVLEIRQGHPTPIPWQLCRTLLFKSSSIWQMIQIHSKKLHNMWACLKRWHTCVLGREKEGAVEQISQLTSSSAHPRPACPYYYPAGAQSGSLHCCKDRTASTTTNITPHLLAAITCSSEWHQDVLRHRDRGVRTQRGPRRVRHVPGAVSFRQYFDTDNNVSGWQALLQSGRSILGLPLYSGRSITCNDHSLLQYLCDCSMSLALCNFFYPCYSSDDPKDPSQCDDARDRHEESLHCKGKPWFCLVVNIVEILSWTQRTIWLFK